MIRFANIDDLERIVDIYNQAIPHRNATADLWPVRMEQRRAWFNEHENDTYPIYVREMDGRVAGWCSLSPYRSGRTALKRTAELTVYIDYGYHGRGIGTELIRHALADCARIGKKIVFGIILEINARSIKTLEKQGFERWGYLPDVAEFDGRLCGHVYMGKKIQ
ncbi:MAG: GNAT family N-acetyltransferase [Proteobacteria bacterium]|nr:GNAT family N-acetyltransferase [Pseudomonadota bacterium]